jgi:hypothetical protein
VIVIGIVSLIAGLSLFRDEDEPAPQQTRQFEVATPHTDTPVMALSADGRLLAFVANEARRPMLWVRSLDTVENRRLAGTENAQGPRPVRQAVDGTGEAHRLFPNDTPGAALSWTRDRQYVLLRQQLQGQPDLVAASLDGSQIVAIAQSRADEPPKGGRYVRLTPRSSRTVRPA